MDTLRWLISLIPIDELAILENLRNDIHQHRK